MVVAFGSLGEPKAIPAMNCLNAGLKSFIQTVVLWLFAQIRTNASLRMKDLMLSVRSFIRRGTALKVAQNIGVSVPVLYKWKKDLLDDEAYQSMRRRKAAPQDKNQDTLIQRWKILSAYWTGTYAGITRSESRSH
jgi:hypothetical protein